MSCSWSFSHYSTLLRCKQLYQYQIIDKAPEFQEVDGNLKFGTALHAALNAIVHGKNGESLFELTWEEEEGNDHDYGYKHNHASIGQMGLGFLSKFRKAYLKDIEPIFAEERLFGTYGDIKLEGTPDLIAKYKGVVTLFDFKTSAYSYDKDKATNSLQMYLYAYLAEQNKIANVEQICYLVFCKDKGSIQTPIIEKIDKNKSLHMLEDMQNYIKMLTSSEVNTKNPNACFMGKHKCPAFDRCWKGKQ